MSDAGNHIWTADEDALLAKLRKLGNSYTEIAERLRMSRGQIAGRCNRLFVADVADQKIKRHDRKTGHSVATKQAKHLNKTLQRPFGISGGGFNGARPARGCLFPLWGVEQPTHAYCGAPRKGLSPYCDEHHAKCYVGVSK